MGGVRRDDQLAKLKNMAIPGADSKPAERRRWVILHRKAGFKTSEIAKKLGVKRQRVEALIERAIELGETENIPKYARVVKSASGRAELRVPPKIDATVILHLAKVGRGLGEEVPSQFRGVYARAGLIEWRDSTDKWALTWRGRYYKRRAASTKTARDEARELFEEEKERRK